jgi:hypothetical protein
MRGLPVVESLLWAAVIACHAVLVARLLILRLHLRYKWFFCYLVIRLARSLLLASLNHFRNVYGWTYVLSEPLIWVLYVLVVLELYTLVLKDYPGIRSLSRWVLIFGLAASTILSVLSLVVDLSGAPPRYPILLYVSVMERGVVTSLVFFLLLITGFLVWYPVSLCRNVVAYYLGYAVAFLASSLALLVRNVAGHTVTRPLSTALQAVELACLVFWIAALNRRGESVPTVLGHRWRPEEEEHLVGQLDAINQSLLKAARK